MFFAPTPGCGEDTESVGVSTIVGSAVFNLLVIIGRDTGTLKWEYQNHQLGGQHDCQMLDNGNILVFANGYDVPGPKPNYSEVWEIEPESKEIVWRYFAKDNPMTFWSPHLSGCQRLSSGNTLICESAFGRLFEVTPAGEVVWEYVIPEFAEYPAPLNQFIRGAHNTCFRAHRYAESQVPWL